jgi:hypothetical protein
MFSAVATEVSAGNEELDSNIAFAINQNGSPSSVMQKVAEALFSRAKEVYTVRNS